MLTSLHPGFRVVIPTSAVIRHFIKGSGQVRSGNLISPWELLARGYFVAPRGASLRFEVMMGGQA